MEMTQERVMKQSVAYEDARALSNMLKERRAEMGLKQEDVAAQTGLSQQDISNSERLNPMSGFRLYNFLILLRFYGIEPNEAARVLKLI